MHTTFVGRARRVLSLGVAAAALGGCSVTKLPDVLDWKVPKLPIEKVQTVADARDVATIYTIALGRSDDVIANEVQLFEVPMIAAAATAVGALAFGAHSDLALGAGLVGAGLGASNDYYAPRKRREHLLAARDAMACVAGVAGSLEPKDQRADLETHVDDKGTIRTEKYSARPSDSDPTLKAAVEGLKDAKKTLSKQASDATSKAIVRNNYRNAGGSVLAGDALIQAVEKDVITKQALLDVSKKAGEAAQAVDQAIAQAQGSVQLLIDTMVTIDNRLRMKLLSASRVQDYSALETRFKLAQKQAYELAVETEKVRTDYSNRVRQAVVPAGGANPAALVSADVDKAEDVVDKVNNPTVKVVTELPDRLTGCLAKIGS
jgi:hypothetical protein